MSFESYDFSNRLQARNNTVSAGTRFANILLDTVFTLPITLYLYFNFMEMNWETGEMTGDKWIAQVVTSFFTTGYYFFMEAGFGQTLGKMITGTKVVDEQGDQPEFSAIGIRSICRLIPFEFISFFGPKTIGWHDSLSKTYVVGKNFKPEQELEDILDA